MWFAPMSSYAQHPWILNLVARLLQGKCAPAWAPIFHPSRWSIRASA
ncbi:hypothetical protein [Vitiosangium sp. GDMCC 1.1324]|nr:hypothetical protein DAT35_51955 [Vitiosangium sp. GDMCC 1.1324]